MTHIKIRGFKIYRDRHGKTRCYHRETGVAIDLVKYPLGSPEFIAECGKLYKPKVKPKTGTLGGLIVEYKTSPSFQNLRPNSQNFYNAAFDYLKPIADEWLVNFDRPLVIKIRDKVLSTRGWHFANRIKTTLSTLFAWGLERGIMNDNPARQIKRIPRPKDKPRANRPWTDAERYAVLEAATLHLRVPIALMMYVGMDPSDAIALRKDQYDGEAIQYKRAKTGEPVWRPAPKALKAILEQSKHDAVTIAATASGKPWTRDGLNTVWMRLKTKLRSKGDIGEGLTLKGLRHTSATIMGEMGYDDRTIADAHGQTTEGMARWYSRDANRRKKLVDVNKKLDQEERKRRRNLSNLPGKVSNPKKQTAKNTRK